VTANNKFIVPRTTIVQARRARARFELAARSEMKRWLSGVFITPHAAQTRVMKQLQSKTLDWGYLKLLKVGSEKLMPMLCIKVGESGRMHCHRNSNRFSILSDEGSKKI
jgi:hypothetical protein